MFVISGAGCSQIPTLWWEPLYQSNGWCGCKYRIYSPFRAYCTSCGLAFCCQSTWELLAIALRVPNSFLKTCVQPSLVAVSVTDIDLWFNSVQSRRSSNNSVFFMGANIIILGFYANKENEQYKNLGLSENASWNDIGSFCWSISGAFSNRCVY